jgi:hypothetical protein
VRRRSRALNAARRAVALPGLPTLGLALAVTFVTTYLAPHRRGVSDARRPRNVHLDARKTPNVTLPMPDMGNVHVDVQEASNVTLRAVPPSPTPRR